MTLNRLISELVKLTSEHGDLPVRIYLETNTPAMSPIVETKTIISKVVKVGQDSGLVFIEGVEE